MNISLYSIISFSAVFSCLVAADELPSYARPTTSSQQRFRKTPPLTDYLDNEGTQWTLPTQSVTSEKTEDDLYIPQTVSN